MTGNHARHGARAAQKSGSRLAVPFQPPVNLLSRPFLRLFNFAYRNRKGAAKSPRPCPTRASSFRSTACATGTGSTARAASTSTRAWCRSRPPAPRSPRLLDVARKAGQGSFLTVLKRFGPMRSPGIVSFPRAGYTLTLDFPNKGQATLDMLAELDRITVEAGGAVNPYKDARMSAQTFAASFPDWRMLEARATRPSCPISGRARRGGCPAIAHRQAAE